MSTTQPKQLLLIWDAPNIDMSLGTLLGGRPEPQHRPRFDAIGRWLLAQAGAQSHYQGQKIQAVATLFCNVPPHNAEQMRPWVDAVRNIGFAVFAKPKLNEASDVDPDMLDLIRQRQQAGLLGGVIVASADGRNFHETLRELIAAEIPVQVLGFREHAAWAVQDSDIHFVDLEEIPKTFREPLPRVNLANLPSEGAWLEPLQPLNSLLRSKANAQTSEGNNAE